MLSRAFVSRYKVALMRFFNIFVRSTIEYATPIWNPTELDLRAQLELIQRRYTRKLFEQGAPDCDSRLSDRVWSYVRVFGCEEKHH